MHTLVRTHWLDATITQKYMYIIYIYVPPYVHAQANVGSLKRERHTDRESCSRNRNFWNQQCREQLNFQSKFLMRHVHDVVYTEKYNASFSPKLVQKKKCDKKIVLRVFIKKSCKKWKFYARIFPFPDPRTHFHTLYIYIGSPTKSVIKSFISFFSWILEKNVSNKSSCKFFFLQDGSSRIVKFPLHFPVQRKICNIYRIFRHNSGCS